MLVINLVYSCIALFIGEDLSPVRNNALLFDRLVGQRRVWERLLTDYLTIG